MHRKTYVLQLKVKVRGALLELKMNLWKVSVFIQSERKIEIINVHDCIPVGCIPPARWPYLPACSAPGGCLVPGEGVSAPGGFAPGGQLLGGGIPVCTEAAPPCEQNHTHLWKYNLAPTWLRVVIIQWRIQDFPDREVPTPEMRAPTYYFGQFVPQNCMKLKNIKNSSFHFIVFTPFDN